MKAAQRACDVIALEAKGVTQYGVQLSRVLIVLEQEAAITLLQQEIEYIRARFANHRGEVNLQEIIHSCNLGRPDDFLDPDQHRDLLPQPYRMIVELFETEILDQAWFEVLRRHPEIEIDSQGFFNRTPIHLRSLSDMI